jgi:ABC-2 type transport system permease protein
VIPALFAASWRHLGRDRSALLLSFALPVAFFSLSSLAFQGLHRGPREPLGIHVVDLDRSPASRSLIGALDGDHTVALWEDPSGACRERLCAIDEATRSIVAGRASGALIIAAGFAEGATSDRGERIDLLVAESDPIGMRLLERSVSDALVERSSPSTGLPVQRIATAVGDSDRLVRGALSGLLVVFLLFTAAGASGWLIEEEQQATLSMLLTTRAGIGHVFGAQWLFLSSLGIVQSVAMVTWATVVFGLVWAGFPQVLRVSLVAVATTAATAAFGLCLAALVRTRAQLGAASMISILILSAIGGSFVPRAVMPAAMQTLGLAIPTTWAVWGLWQALDRETSFAAVIPAVVALSGFAALLLTVATLLARHRVVS